MPVPEATAVFLAGRRSDVSAKDVTGGDAGSWTQLNERDLTAWNRHPQAHRLFRSVGFRELSRPRQATRFQTG
jgi:hypothetical protein